MSVWIYQGKVGGLDLDEIEAKCRFCRCFIEPIFQINTSRGQYWYHHDFREHVWTCPQCGWWRYEREEELDGDTDEREPYLLRRSVWAMEAQLKSLAGRDLSIPLQDVRDFLTARFGRACDIHPRLFEETVASVFKSLGYSVLVTGYSNDGGIDVILTIDEETIGVQVKRSKNSIEVEQIRALAGALLLGGFTRGVFVTTSQFTSGARSAASEFSHRGLAMELINGHDFYAALAIVQQEVRRTIEALNLEELRAVAEPILVESNTQLANPARLKNGKEMANYYKEQRELQERQLELFSWRQRSNED